MSGARSSRTRLLAIGVLAAAAVAGVVLLFFTGGEDTYDVEMRLDNANGLRNGSPVVVGGVNVGEVSLEATDDDVQVTLMIREQYAPVGKDASATIIAQNALGQKQVRVELGDRSNPAPEGFTLDSSRVVAATDIDQLLSTFDPDTRTRLAILINETGTAFAGRELSFKTFIRDFAPALSSGGEVLDPAHPRQPGADEPGRDERPLHRQPRSASACGSATPSTCSGRRPRPSRRAGSSCARRCARRPARCDPRAPSSPSCAAPPARSARRRAC